MKKYITLMTFALSMALVLSLCAACSGQNHSDQPPLASGSVIVADDSIPDRAPNITGVVTGIADVREGVTMLVEIPGKNNTYADGRVYVTVTAKTIVQTNDKKPLEESHPIQPGDTVSVWYSGNSTGTSPEYAMAQGVRVTSRVEDQLLTVKLGDATVMASPTEGDVTRTDIKPLLYGSYLIYPGEGNLYIGFPKAAIALSATALPLREGENGYHLKADPERMLLEVPANMTAGEYLVTLKIDYENGADYYMFTLNVQ